jgi:hypothetical protein
MENSMLKKIILSLVVAMVVLYGIFIILKKPTISEDELSKLERMTDTRDPKTISGSFWTDKLDCTYKNPPKEITATVLAFSCEATTHNVQVLKTGGSYFIPRSTADDNPPFCLVKKPADSSTVQIAKERQSLYCRKEWALWQHAQHFIGFL